MLDLPLARFKANASPPTGNSLCGGWIKPVERADDSLLLRGIVFQVARDLIAVAAEGGYDRSVALVAEEGEGAYRTAIESKTGSKR